MTLDEAREILKYIKYIKSSLNDSQVFARHNEALDLAIKALEQQPNRCDSCTHYEEQDGSNCYECVKGMVDNFEAQMTNKEMTNRCEYCTQAVPLVIGNSDDKGICLMYPNYLSAYGYDIHGSGSNGLIVKINYCPMCGRLLNSDWGELEVQE